MSESVSKRNKQQGAYLLSRHIRSFDFVRFVAVFMIIVFHYYVATPYADRYTPLWGREAVAMFFIISGAGLINRYYDSIDVREFYIKRAKSIFPAFWLSYFIIFLWNYVESSFHFASAVPAVNFIFTILGVDGLVTSMGIPTFYIIGEWFLGVIIILYLIFPLFRKIFIKYPTITLVVTFILRICLLLYNPFPLLVRFNPIVALSNFTLGAWLVIQYHNYSVENNIKNTDIIIPHTKLTLFLCFIGIVLGITIGVFGGIFEDVGEIFSSAGLFFLLILISQKINSEFVWRIVDWYSKISFEMFLFQHVIIVRFIPFVMNNFTKFNFLICLVWIIFVISSISYAVHGFTIAIKHSLADN